MLTDFMKDLAIKLTMLRQSLRLTQEQVSTLSGVGVKTLSSFETGHRIESMKVSQLASIVAVYDMTVQQFMKWDGRSVKPRKRGRPRTTSPVNAFIGPVFRRPNYESEYPTPSSSLGWS
jgi:transcriptional regulator with XRE-family HTH domain